MDFIKEEDRFQIEFCCLEDLIEADNPIRFIDAFVEQLDLKRLGFEMALKPIEGRPPFRTSLFLKIYLYAYLNGLRSSRRIATECGRNIELQWLCGRLQPNYHSIADFRKENPKALRNTFKLFVLFLKDADLVSGKTIAIDGTKVRAHNSKKNNFSPKKIERHLAYIELKTAEYLQLLDNNDVKADKPLVKDIKEKMARLNKNKIHYECLQEEMQQTGEIQISTTDPDSRALLVQGQVVEVCYNMQAAVDDKHKLVVATHTINRNDRNALSDIALETKSNLQLDKFTALSDKGYHNGREIQRCYDHGISTIVAVAQLVNSNDKGTTQEYLVDKFVYNKAKDTYKCPAGQILRTQGTWHEKWRDLKHVIRFKKYRTPHCKDCSVKHLCTGKAKGGREIERTEYAEAVSANNKRYHENPALYRKRQEINEHIFGTIKRKWGFNHTNLKGLDKVNGEMALIMTVYNMKRCMNILGMRKMLLKIKTWKPDYKRIARLCSKSNFILDLASTQNIGLALAA